MRRKDIYIRCMTLAAAFLLALHAGAYGGGFNYQTETLRQLAGRIGFSESTATFRNGLAEARKVNGMTTILECGKEMTITHVGISLFPRQLKQGSGSQPLLLRFLERYFLDVMTQTATSTENRMADDKVYFTKGTQADVAGITPEMPFSISTNDKFYEASWQKNGKPFITVMFPKQAELIYGANFAELQRSVRIQVMSSPAAAPAEWEGKRLVDAGFGLLKTDGDKYVLDAISDAVYLSRDGGKLTPVFSDAQPDASAANLLLGALPGVDCLMAVEQPVYGFKTENYTVSLSKWLGYCEANGTHLYYAMEEAREDGIKAYVLAQNVDLQYTHILSVVVPKGIASAKTKVVKARLNAFIPTHNVKDLFQKNTSKKRVKYE